MTTTLNVSEVMTRNVLTADAEWSVDELRDFLLEYSISGAPVTDRQGKLLGVVSTTDLLRSASEGAATTLDQTLYAYSLDRPLPHEDLRGLDVRALSAMKVREIMTPMVFEVRASAPVREAAETMTRGRIHRVFVTDGGKVVGVVSALDLVRVLRDMLEG
ncbi:MAG: CBS domain-containing protein [Myxococcales bacterium]|nr:CBS domain-containing protein [Myxococcales bacterium]